MSRHGARRCLAILFAAGLLSVPARPGWCGWTSFTTADGLVGNFVNSILEDRSGNLWFATSRGVSRYDGATWRTFTFTPTSPAGPDDFNPLSPNAVSSILEDRSGNVWIATGDGVRRYDGVTWKSFTRADGLGDVYAYSILEDRSGNLWFGTRLGVSRYDGTAWRSFTTADGLTSYPVESILEDRSGNLWLATRGGVSRYDGTTWRTYTTADGLASNTVVSILEDRSGNLWFGTWDAGVSRYDGTAWKTFTTADGLAGQRVASILQDHSGNLWFGTNGFGTYGGGVSRYDGTRWRSFTPKDGLADDPVTSIAEDVSGNLWLGTAGSGVSRFDGATWKIFSTADGIAANSVWFMLEDRAERLWFATFGGGVSRYDGSTWKAFTTADGLASNYVISIFEDHLGNMWFGTWDGGVSRFDGTKWKTFTAANGLAGDRVLSILEDRAGNLWFGTALRGVSRFDGKNWKTYTTVDGLAGTFDTSVYSMLEDSAGNLWFGTSSFGLVSRFDGSTWTTFGTADGTYDYVSSIRQDRSGTLWFGTHGGGVSRFDGTNWTRFTRVDGLASDDVTSIVEDRSGAFWFATSGGGASRFDGATWRTFTAPDGLADNSVACMLEDHSGNLWFSAGAGGVSRYEPDRIDPQTLLVITPPRVTAATDHAISFAAFGETQGLEFAYRLSGGPWSEWSRVSNAHLSGLADGRHFLEVRSRDFMLNTDETPAQALFEVDAAPPAPVIATPTFGQAVKAQVEVHGTASDPRFVSYRLEVRPEGAPTWNPPDATRLSESTTPATGGLLGVWETSGFPDGRYNLRLSVTDSLGLTGTGQVTAIVDNHAPFANVTTPARITAATGGDIFTTNSELRLYFPPRAFREDAVVTITPAAEGSAPDTLASGAVLASPGFEIGWGTASLAKPARLEISRTGLAGYSSAAGAMGAPGAGSAAPATSAALALWHSSDGTAWARLGGTMSGDRIEANISKPGMYALYLDAGPVMGAGTVSGLSFTPRVFSPTGTFADREVGIAFTLGRPANVTVRVYSRSGRLVRTVVETTPLSAGSNLIRWDGRDRNGNYTTDDMYLVTVEALGHIEKKPIAVVK